MSLFGELKRRHVLRAGAAYAVTSWLLIQVAETIFPLFGFDDAAARLVVIVLAIGFIPAMVFAWAFEITPSGIRRESEVDDSQTHAPYAGRTLDRIVMVVLALVLGYFAFDKFVLEPARDEATQARLTERFEKARQQGQTDALLESYGGKSIAVLPFLNMSGDAGDEYFSDGISEELLNLLAKVPELRVISRTSAFAYKGKSINLSQVAQELRVAHILEGSVRRAGSRVRITAQLIDARADTNLWSETYDRELTDIFTIQDEISAMVVSKLKLALLGDAPKARETDTDAYVMCLQANYLNGQGRPDSLARANDLYTQALAIDPTYIDALDGLASNYVNQVLYGVTSADEGLGLAREAVRQVLAIDPDNAKAHARLGRIASASGNDELAEAAQHYQRAMALAPTDLGVLANAGTVLAYLGRVDEAIVLEEYVNALDPVDPRSYWTLGTYYRYAGRLDDAISAYRSVLRLSPDFVGAHYMLGEVLLLNGNPEGALAEFLLEEGDEQYQVKGQALALHALGRKADFDTKMIELIKRWGGEWPSEVAQVYAYIGDADAAFGWLDKAIAQNEVGLNEQFLNPLYASLHDDPRWGDFQGRVGSSSAQRDAIAFAVPETVPGF
ncbi:MAG: tetratricopeptide repeat protein [Pseudomonadota bacterium]